MVEIGPVHDLLKKLKAQRLSLVEAAARGSGVADSGDIEKLARLQSAIDAVSCEIEEHEAKIGYGSEAELK